jgi:hypothetical protein
MKSSIPRKTQQKHFKLSTEHIGSQVATHLNYTAQQKWSPTVWSQGQTRQGINPLYSLSLWDSYELYEAKKESFVIECVVDMSTNSFIFIHCTRLVHSQIMELHGWKPRPNWARHQSFVFLVSLILIWIAWSKQKKLWVSELVGRSVKQ